MPVTLTPLRIVPAGLAVGMMIVVAAFLMSPSRDRLASRGQDPDRMPVVFTLRLPEANSVSIMGTFNQWNPKGFDLRYDREKGVWSIALLLPAGRHEYAFLVNGKEMVPDPQAHLYQDDGFGHRNSVLILRGKNGQDA